jgi:hypothetical protein
MSCFIAGKAEIIEIIEIIASTLLCGDRDILSGNAVASS